ncbi:hypothetical protein ACIBQX_19690 [Nonomuraea sp. NPDC049714]|uniref:hypothetical protein n=1 Tax=Nonomuraea sp. NPDC049714 TaxID=3364357 RepID=UPI0037A82B47
MKIATQYCDRVVVLAAGRIVADGPPARVFSPELIRTIFGVDVRVLGDTDDPVFAFRRLDAGEGHIDGPSTQTESSVRT